MARLALGLYSASQPRQAPKFRRASLGQHLGHVVKTQGPAAFVRAPRWYSSGASAQTFVASISLRLWRTKTQPFGSLRLKLLGATFPRRHRPTAPGFAVSPLSHNRRCSPSYARCPLLPVERLALNSFPTSLPRRTAAKKAVARGCRAKKPSTSQALQPKSRARAAVPRDSAAKNAARKGCNTKS